MRQPSKFPSRDELMDGFNELQTHYNAFENVLDIESSALSFFKLELEAQNQALQDSHQLLQETLDLYAHLYDFAPVACTTLDQYGNIREINLTGAHLLKSRRDKIIGKPLKNWMTESGSLKLFAHLQKCRERREKIISPANISIAGEVSIPVMLMSNSDAKNRNNFQTVILDLREVFSAVPSASE
jgi:transcriptional regulator with PAS, ATPase and Fis domain